MKHLPEIERQSSDQILNFQFEKVKEVIAYARERSLFYSERFAKTNLSISAVSSWEDFKKIPPTTKDDLQTRNWDFLCVPRDQVAEYTSTSGTLGKPVTIALTKRDIERLGYNECISFECAGGDETDLYQLMLTLDRQFMAGIAYYEGIKRLGAGLVRVGPGLPSMQWETIDRLKPTALVAVPSFIVKLIEFAEKERIDLNKSSVEKIICIGENIRDSKFQFNALSKRITNAWSVKLFSTYASTEMQTAFTECAEGHGGHLHPELIFVELLDEAGNEVSEGEVTITTFGVEGMPLIRYRTGDIARKHTEKCSCGRNTLRIGPIIGRKQQMVKLKGTTIYPPGIFDILNQVNAVDDYMVEAYYGSLGADEIRIFIATHHDHHDTLKLLQSTFQSRLRIVPEIIVSSAKEVEAMQMSGGSRKVKKFIDHRK
jgi:phenylacetate-CoA ligase